MHWLGPMSVVILKSDVGILKIKFYLPLPMAYFNQVIASDMVTGNGAEVSNYRWT